jgi:hypothetical protein
VSAAPRLSGRGTVRDVETLIAATVTRVAELPDRSSPDDRPDMMLVTAEELATELRAFAVDLLAGAAPSIAPSIAPIPWARTASGAAVITCRWRRR